MRLQSTAEAADEHAVPLAEDLERERAEAAAVLEHVLLRAQRAKRRLYRIQVAISVPAIAWLVYLGPTALAHPSLMPAPAVLLPGILLVISLLPAWLVQRSLGKAKPDLARLEDVRLLGPLTDLMANGDTETRRLIGKALARILPRLTVDDAYRLDAGQRGRLYARLSAPLPDQVDLQVALLGALEHVGDASAMSLVERLASWPPRDPPDPAQRRVLIEHHPLARRAWRSHNACQGYCHSADRKRHATSQEEREVLRSALREAEAALEVAVRQAHEEPYQRVREAARECLPRLRARIERQRTSDALLRPAEAPPGEMLLRPAQVTGEVDPGMLLRPVEGGEG